MKCFKLLCDRVPSTLSSIMLHCAAYLSHKVMLYCAAATNAGEIRVDPLQRLHALQNLAWLLGPAGDGVPSVPRTLRDGNLQAHRPHETAAMCAV